MAFVTLPNGLLWPLSVDIGLLASGSGLNMGTSATLDAATEKTTHIGRVYIDGRPASAKTISAAGGGSISFRTGAVTFANGGTTLELGIQDVAAGAGPAAQPDGTFDVSRVLTGGTDTINANGWNTFAMTGGSGSKSITHGDLIAVVWDMTARAGADSVLVTPRSGNGTQAALTNNFLAGAWQAGSQGVPNVVIVFDDGTLGIIDSCMPVSSAATDTYSDSTNPDERGLAFQVPFDNWIDAFYASIGQGGATADGTLKLWSDPFGTPSLIASLALLAEQMGSSSASPPSPWILPQQYQLSRNADYALTWRATAAGSVRLSTSTLGSENYRAFFPGGTTLKKVTRNNDTGAFTAESPAVTMYLMGVRISQVPDGAGAGGGLKLAGSGGLAG